MKLQASSPWHHATSYFAGTAAYARTGKVPKPAKRAGAAVNTAAETGRDPRPVRCSTTGMPAASRMLCAGRCVAAMSSMLTASMPVSYTHLDVYKRQGRMTTLLALLVRWVVMELTS